MARILNIPRRILEASSNKLERISDKLKSEINWRNEPFYYSPDGDFFLSIEYGITRALANLTKRLSHTVEHYENKQQGQLKIA